MLHYSSVVSRELWAPVHIVIVAEQVASGDGSQDAAGQPSQELLLRSLVPSSGLGVLRADRCCWVNLYYFHLKEIKHLTMQTGTWKERHSCWPYNTDEPRGRSAKWNKSDTKQSQGFHLCEGPGVVRGTERGLGNGKWAQPQWLVMGTSAA